MQKEIGGPDRKYVLSTGEGETEKVNSEVTRKAVNQKGRLCSTIQETESTPLAIASNGITRVTPSEVKHLGHDVDCMEFLDRE